MPDFQLDKESLDRWFEQMPQSSDLTLVVLKGHLLLEEQLAAIIKAAVPDPSQLPKLGFAARLKLVRALCPFKYEECYEIIEAVNQLRNALSHELEPPELPSLVRNIVKPYNHLGMGSGEDPDAPETIRLVLAFANGFLSSRLDQVKGGHSDNG